MKTDAATATHVWPDLAGRIIEDESGRRHVLQMLHTLQHRPDAKDSTGTRLHELLTAAGNVVRRRSTVFVVSDFISEPGWEKPLAQLALRHEVVAVRLHDPLELELPDLGHMAPVTHPEVVNAEIARFLGDV